TRQSRQQPLARGGDEPSDEKQSNVAQGTGLSRRLEERRGLARSPRERLDRVEQQRQKGCAKTGAEPREGDRDPEARSGGIAKRRRRACARFRLSDGGGGGLGPIFQFW